jgi:hypothetical protein
LKTSSSTSAASSSTSIITVLHNAFIDLGLKNFNEIYSKAQQSHLFDDFEKGTMPPENFRAELRKYLPSETTDGTN